MLRMAFEPRVNHLRDFRVGLQELSNDHSVVSVTLHADLKCLQSSKSHVAVERGRNSADRVLEELQLLVDFRVVGCHHAHDDITMAIDVLGHGVHDNVCSEIQRALDRGRAKRVVNHQYQALLLCRFGHGLDIGDLECRIRWSLQPHHTRARSYGRLKRPRLGEVHEREFHAISRLGNPREVAVRAAVDIVDRDDVVPRVEHVDDGHCRGGSGRKRKGVLRVL
mmetsp:Transcript_35830/g.69605  ORF Transcript_35830/g.69605 Transcript_35830/m.69605 type:complete len:223 (+) Transcript_35830:597-1265(+)